MPAQPAFDPEETPPDQTLRLVERREHDLQSLFELSHEIHISGDVYRIAEMALLNLIGHFGTVRAALWLLPEERPSQAVLIRSFGLDHNVARAIGLGLAPQAQDRFGEYFGVVRLEAWARDLRAPGAGLAVEHQLELMAPVVSRGRLLGLMALGCRLDRQPYAPIELDHALAAGHMIGVAIENARLVQRALETNRGLQQANERLAELDRLKAEFIQTVNHELQTPLTILIGYHSTLEAFELPAAVRRAHEAMMEQTLKLSGMVQDLLDYSSINEDTARLEIESGDIGPILRTYATARRPGVVARLRELDVAIADAPLNARADRKRLLRVLEILIDNAVKFTPHGTRIRLVAEPCLEAGEPWLRIEVQDDGPGIASEHMPTLFEPLRQVDGSMTRSVGGIGLGLALARELVSRMGGNLGVQSELGRGTRVRLLLPAS